ILQSGAALGSIFTPLIVIGFLAWTGSWRPPFLVIGALGLVWVVLWLKVVRRDDLVQAAASAGTNPGLASPAVIETSVRAGPPRQAGPAGHTSVGAILRDRRFWILALVVSSINCAWHFFRVWLPL